MPKKQKSGLYRTKVKVGTDQTGKPIVKWVSGKTQKELEDAKREVIARYITGTSPRDDMLFGVYCTQWYNARIVPTVADSTRESYRHMLNKYVLPAFGERNLRAISSMDVQQWINDFAGMSNTQITLAATVMRGVFRTALSDNLIVTDPTTQLLLPRASKPAERRALTDAETQALLPLMDTTRDGQYLAVLYYLGLRPGEARGLQWGDFDWTARSVHIQRDIDYAAKGAVGDLKTDAANRIVPVPDELYDLLYPTRGLPTAFLFVGIKNSQPLSKTSAYTLWLSLMVRAGLAEELENDRRANDLRAHWRCDITPYYLRHNYITKCWQAGLDPLIVQRIVGHKDYRTTANIYTHLNDAHILHAKDKIESVFAPEMQLARENKVAQKLHKSETIPYEQKEKALKSQ